MTTIAVIDFETTGVSPGQGARATEVGIALLGVPLISVQKVTVRLPVLSL